MARDSERSSRVKFADHGFASRQSASLVPIKRGKLRRFALYNARELCVPLKRLKVNHLFNFIGLERCAPGALNAIDRLHQPELLSQNPQRLVVRIRQEPCNQGPATATHAIKIDLGSSDPPRVRSAAASGSGPAILRAIASANGASAGSDSIETFKPRRNAFCAERAFPGAVFGTVLDFNLARLARCWRSVVKAATSAHFAGFDVGRATSNNVHLAGS